MKMKGYTASSGRFCQAATSGIIFSVILVTNSGEISTSYRLLICSAMSRWLMPQAYRDRILSSMPSTLRLYFPMILGSKEPLRSRGTLMSTSPSWVLMVFFP